MALSPWPADIRLASQGVSRYCPLSWTKWIHVLDIAPCSLVQDDRLPS
jgi:hypothetical protein